MRIEIRHAYDSKLSKNEQHAFIPVGKKNPWDGLPGVPAEPQKQRMVVNKASAVALMAGIEKVARGECTRVRQKTGEEFERHKIYVDIMVYRPDMRTDPVNFVDMICDAVKRGIGIDDNIYAGSWDWELVEGKGEIVIVVRQEATDT